MILKFIINILINITFAIFSLITAIFPSSDIDISTLITTLLSVTSQATNFMHFLFGDWLFVILPYLTLLLFAKFVILPMFSFFRGFLRFGSS